MEYYVTLTYIATVDADNYDDASDKVLKMVENGDLVLKNIEVEEKMTPFQEMKQGLKEAIDFVMGEK